MLGGAAVTLLVPHRSRATDAPRTGCVSLTYDDGLPCHLDIAAPALEQRGLRGTFYVTWENIVDRSAEWEALAKRGHELANHTVHHPCDLAPISPERLKTTELAPMERWLERVEGPGRLHSFAYTCDVTNLGAGGANRQARRYADLLRVIGITSARTSEGPPNPFGWARRHPFDLQALAVGYDAQSVATVTDYLLRAVQQKRWAILVFHRLDPGPMGDGNVSPADHATILDAVVRLGLACRTVEEQMRVIEGDRPGA